MVERLMSSKLIAVKTTRYSAFFRRLFEEYKEYDDATVKIDGKKYANSAFPMLIDKWCRNSKIVNTRDFALIRGKNELFSFHDHPEALLAAISELPFLEKLAADQLVRFRVGKFLK
jgi:hypothetical protein